MNQNGFESDRQEEQALEESYRAQCEEEDARRAYEMEYAENDYRRDQAKATMPNDRISQSRLAERLTKFKEEPVMSKTLEDVRKAVYASKRHSAWERGVQTYALELLDNLQDDPDGISASPATRKALFNGADSWQQYSEGGCSLVYDGEIAERLCNPTELKKSHGGERDPNERENWIDLQARALSQAERMIWKCIRA